MNQGGHHGLCDHRRVPRQAGPGRGVAELIDRHAHNSRTLEGGCLAFDVCQDPDDPTRFVLHEAYRDQDAHRRHLEMDSYEWFRAMAPDLLVPGSETSLPHHRQVLTRRPYLSE